MTSTNLTAQQRATKVKEAHKALRAAMTSAMADVENPAAWLEVEKLGATIHRQSRLLAGKTRGG